MVLAYVTMQPSLAAGAGQRVYALLLPDAAGDWAELEVRPSAVDAAGFGLVPSQRGALDWSDLADPALLNSRAIS